MTAVKPWDVVVFGDLYLDLVMTGFPCLPQLGEEGFATGFGREIGGGTAITACGLGVLGARTRVIGVVGEAEAAWFHRRFQSKGVDTTALVTHPSEPTAITVAISTPEDRVFYTYAAANALVPELINDSAIRQNMAEARHVHLAHFVDPVCLQELVQWLHAQHCTVSIDPGWMESWLDAPATLRALAEVDWFFPNEREAKRLSGKAEAQSILRWFKEQRFKGVVLKLGAEGSATMDGEEVICQSSPSVTPTDTTGAGDCFDAGFLYAWLQEKPLRECLAWGNVCGALSTRSRGGIEGFPTRVEVEGEIARGR